MKTERMQALITSGQVLKEDAAKRGEPMIPMLVLLPAAGGVAQVIGLAVEKEHWPRVFDRLRRQRRAYEAAITFDAAWRPGLPEEGEPPPLEDPASMRCLLIVRATTEITEIALVPYRLTDTGTIAWDEVRDVTPSDIHGSMLDALQGLVRP